MNETLNWDDLRLFLSVARAGGLAGAVSATRVSPPTLGRRMTSLERALGTALFVRRRDGYALTRKGEELLQLAEAVEQGALGVERWRTAADHRPVVKISAGAWTSGFLARHMAELIGGEERLAVEILSGPAPADLLRREANLGLRNRRPEISGLAARRLVPVAFAVYGAADLVRDRPETRDARRFDACPWIAFAPPGPKVPSAAWLDRQLPREARLKCSTAQTVLEAARAGNGLCVLPCFVGDAEPALARASGPISELTHDQWLVSHDDDRHSGPIRRMAGRIAKLIRAQAPLFSGAQPGQRVSPGPDKS